MTLLEEIQKKNKESLKNLAVLLKIPLKHGWKTALAQALGVDQATVSKWISRASGISEDGVAAAEALGFDPDEWLIEVKADAENSQLLENIKPLMPPGIATGVYRLPEPNGFESKNEYLPTTTMDTFAAAVSGLKEIYESGNPLFIGAIQANIRVFQMAARKLHRVRRQSETIKAMGEEYEDVKKRLSALETTQNPNSLPGPTNGAEKKKTM